MSMPLMVAGLALRELWFSFRLLAVIAVLAGVALLAVGVRLLEPFVMPLPWLAAGLGVGAVAAGALAAWTLAAERRRGVAAWLVTRSVPRGAVLLGWLVALAGPILAGVVAVEILGWVMVPGLSLAPYATAIAVSLADLLAALAAGLFAGTLLRPVPAALLAAVLLGAVAAAGFLAVVPLPGDGLRFLADLPGREPPLADALTAAGVSLLSAGVLLTTAWIALERAEL